MDNEILFKSDTIMEKEDYRKFLYISTFKRDKRSIIFMLVLSLIGALIIAITGGNFSINGLFISWLFMFCVLLAVVCFKIELRYRQRIKTDNTGVFGSVTTIEFYEDYLTMETPIAEGKNKLEYVKFYKIIECGTYFMLYYNMNMATLLRKIDMKGIDLAEFREFMITKFEDKYQKI